MAKLTIKEDLSDPGLFDRGIPHQIFEKIRSTKGLVWNSMGPGSKDGFWNVTRLDDIATVTRHPEIYSSALGHIQIYDIDEDALEGRASMIDMDPPEHTRMRRLVNPQFIPRSAKSYIPVIKERTEKLLDKAIRHGECDWVSAISKPIPISVICDILGVPKSDRNLMIELTDHLVAGTSSEKLDPNAYGNTTPLRLLPFNSPAAFALMEYSNALCKDRKRQPKDDLMSKLVESEVEGERLTEAELSNFFRLLIFAGNETTRTAMSHLAIQMATYPEQFDKIRENPELIDSAIEEVVRFSSPIMYFRRTANQDAELAGCHISAGEKVVMWYASGNFDETKFTNPRQFIVGRSREVNHAGFGGGGVHTCLGATFARIELKILLELMLERNLEIKIIDEPEYVNSNFVNGIEHLKVQLSSSAW